MKKEHTRDDAMASYVCLMLCLIGSVALGVYSASYLKDAVMQKSVQRSSEIDDKIQIWQRSAMDEFQDEFKFTVFSSPRNHSLFDPEKSQFSQDSVVFSEEGNQFLTGIDQDFRGAFRDSLTPYPRLYHEADVKGAEVDEVNLIIVANDLTDLDANPPLVTVSDLNLAMRIQKKQGVIRKEQCWQNYRGQYKKPGTCITHFLLSEVCVVVDKGEDGQWNVVTEKSGKIMGCATKDRDIQKHKKIDTADDPPRAPEQVKFIIRRLSDPAIQALFITDSTFDVGLSPALLLMLSVLGIVSAFGCLVFVFLGCVSLQKAENERVSKLRRDRYRQEEDDEDELDDSNRQIDQSELRHLRSQDQSTLRLEDQSVRMPLSEYETKREGPQRRSSKENQAAGEVEMYNMPKRNQDQIDLQFDDL